MARAAPRALAQATGETINLVVLDGDRVIYVDQVEGTRRVRMFTAVGTAALAHTTGSGKAIMAYSPPGGSPRATPGASRSSASRRARW